MGACRTNAAVYLGLEYGGLASGIVGVVALFGGTITAPIAVPAILGAAAFGVGVGYYTESLPETLKKEIVKKAACCSGAYVWAATCAVTLGGGIAQIAGAPRDKTAEIISSDAYKQNDCSDACSQLPCITSLWTTCITCPTNTTATFVLDSNHAISEACARIGAPVREYALPAVVVAAAVVGASRAGLFSCRKAGARQPAGGAPLLDGEQIDEEAALSSPKSPRVQ